MISPDEWEKKKLHQHWNCIGAILISDWQTRTHGVRTPFATNAIVKRLVKDLLKIMDNTLCKEVELHAKERAKQLQLDGYLSSKNNTEQ